MQAITRVWTLLSLLFLLAVPAYGERPRPLGWAVEAALRGNWESAARIAARDGPVAQDVIEWMRLRAGRGSVGEVTAFLARNPDWPGEPLLRRRAEDRVIRASDATVLAFFAEAPAQTPEGILAHAAALQRAGQSGEAQANLVLAWRTLRMSDAEQALFLTEHGALLKPHHAARLDRMLWDKAAADARRLFALVPDAQATLAKARLGLQARAGNVDALIAAVPETLASDPGLARDRFDCQPAPRAEHQLDSAEHRCRCVAQQELLGCSLR